MEKILKNNGEGVNYLATICRIGETFPIEGADRLVKTVINGYDIAISKDFNVGDIVVYFPVESAICEKYLSANNLYESGIFCLNSNHSEVEKFATAAEKAKNEGNKEEFEKQWGEVKARCGFFGKYGRVRILKLRGQYSQGFIAKTDSIINAFPETKDINWEEEIGTQFNQIGNEDFCWKYIPPKSYSPDIIPNSQKIWKKRMKHLKRFDRIISGSFEFHYDTKMLAERISELSPNDYVSITCKVHGTSGIFANVLCNRKLSRFEKIKKFFGFKVKETEFGNVYSSRSVIKNQYINPNAQSFYDADVWGCVNRDFSPYIEEGMTIYGEIVGYIEGSQQMIQKQHDYGCKPGTWKFMPYRITTTDSEGNKKEWNVSEVYDWTKNFMESHPELAEKVLLINILYYGRLGDLYPELDETQHWHENLLAKMKVDTEHFGMELDEPMCKNKVPREGIVIRIDNDITARAWKLKTLRHYGKEAEQHDKGEVDIEENA